MDGNRLIGRVTLAEIVTLEHARNRVLRRQLDKVGGGQLIHPGGVERHLGFRRIEDLEHLRLIGLGIRQHLITRQRWPGCTLATRITDHSGKVANQKNHLMAQLLKLPQLIDKNGMPEVEIRRRRIETRLDA
ncbi:hypothetical protein D3C80_1402830 [compost metagenome]